MESRRFTVFVKVENAPDWAEHLTFFTRYDAETYAAALKTCFPRIQDYVIVETTRLEERRFG